MVERQRCKFAFILLAGDRLQGIQAFFASPLPSSQSPSKRRLNDLGVNGLGELVEGHALLGQVLAELDEELEGHLDEGAADAVEPVLDLADPTGELVADDVAVLDAAALLVLGQLVGAGDDEVAAEEVVVLLPVADVVRGDWVEDLVEDLGVGARRARPEVPELARHGVVDQAVRGRAEVVLLRVAVDGGPVCVGAVGGLWGFCQSVASVFLWTRRVYMLKMFLTW